MAIMFIDYYKQFLVILMLSVMLIIFKTAKTYISSAYDFALLFVPHMIK